MTYRRFSECSLKSPLSAEGSLGPRTCSVTSGNQTEQSHNTEAEQSTHSHALRTGARQALRHPLQGTAGRDNTRPDGRPSPQPAPNVLERDAVVLFLCGCRKAVGDKCQMGVLLGGAAELLPARFIFNACLPRTIDGLKSGSLRRRGEEWVFCAFVCGARF